MVAPTLSRTPRLQHRRRFLQAVPAPLAGDLTALLATWRRSRDTNRAVIDALAQRLADELAAGQVAPGRIEHLAALLDALDADPHAAADLVGAAAGTVA